jgi:hypothetical protein
MVDWVHMQAKPHPKSRKPRKVTYFVSHIVFGLCSKNTFLALRVPLRNHPQVATKMLADILDNRLRLGDNDLLVRAGRRDSNDWRPSKRMHSFEVWAGTVGRIAFEDFELVLEVQFFEEPHQSLPARLLEPALRSVYFQMECVGKPRSVCLCEDDDVAVRGKVAVLWLTSIP